MASDEVAYSAASVPAFAHAQCRFECGLMRIGELKVCDAPVSFN
jgi:hypothetical protein